jgi:hypothetical protein
MNQGSCEKKNNKGLKAQAASSSAARPRLKAQEKNYLLDL